jgi:hypothetical protein
MPSSLSYTEGTIGIENGEGIIEDILGNPFTSGVFETRVEIFDPTSTDREDAITRASFHIDAVLMHGLTSG